MFDLVCGPKVGESKIREISIFTTSQQQFLHPVNTRGPWIRSGYGLLQMIDFGVV
jgi:hypothetical protein